ncbi:MAG: hypothetical protein ACFCUQ_02725 [Kiloniellales bacterium]
MTDSTAQAADLLKVLNRLIEVLRQEIHMLQQMDPSAMQGLQHDKIVLTAAYESMLAKLRGDPEGLRNLPADMRQQILQLTSTFQTTLTENARALFAVKEANDRLFRAIVEAIEEKRKEGQPYSAGSGNGRSAAARGSQPLAVALDQRL